MKSLTKIVITLNLFSLSVLATELRIDNLKLYQPLTKNFSQLSSVYIDHGKIVDITHANTVQKSADKIINAQNQFALPGFFDLHVHLGASGSSYNEFQYLPVSAHLNSYLYLGITNIADLFSFQTTLNTVKELSKTQATPNLFYAGILFTNPGGHGTQFGGKAYEIHNDAEIDALWKQHIAMKPSITKAVIETFGGTRNTLTDSQLAELGKRSKAADLPYFVHISTLEDGKRAIKAGATVLAHGVNSEAIDDEFLQLMKKYHVAYMPTLAVYYNQQQEKQNHLISQQTSLLATVPNKLQHCLFDKVPAPAKWKKQTWDKRKLAYNNILKLQQAGIKILTGSDAGNPYVLHGAGLYNEFNALHDAGMTNADIINAATINAASTLNKQNTLGQLNIGYEASFILLKDNPLTNLANLKNIQSVYKSGQEVSRTSLISKNQAIEPIGKACNQIITATLANKIIDDFTNMSAWHNSSDALMGGTSRVKLVKENNQLTIKTTLTKPTRFGAWSGAEIKFESAVDASKYHGISITYKGSTIPFGLSIYHSEVKDWDHFSTQLPPSNEWKTVKIPFSELKQYGFGSKIEWSAKSLTGLNLIWRKSPTADDTEIENELSVKTLAYY